MAGQDVIAHPCAEVEVRIVWARYDKRHAAATVRTGSLFRETTCTGCGRTYRGPPPSCSLFCAGVVKASPNE